MKTFYSVILSALIAAQASAQVTERFDGYAFSKFSPDGKWLVENNNGSISILDRNTGKSYTTGDPSGFQIYMVGLGNSVTNSGKIVGSCGDYAGIWYNDEWIHLPQETGVGTTYNGAYGITPDESRIVGILGLDNSSMGNDGLQAYPVVWTKNASGEYSCTKLPFPEKDFLGLTPQYVTAVTISDDGKTVVGQVRDNSGFYVMPIVYRETEDGKWTYTIIGDKEVYDKSRLGELPQVPVQPTYPEVVNYMSDDDIAAYNKAIENYNNLLEQYYNGLIDEYPEYPLYEDYISDPDSKAAYQAAIAKYQEDIQKWQTDYMAYQNKLSEITTNCGFIQNAFCLSGNGRYLGATLEQRSSDGIWGETANYIGYFDLQSGDDPQFVRETEAGDYLLTGILNDATTFVGTPYREYTRNTFVVKPTESGNTTMSFVDYMKSRSESAAKWIQDNNKYDVVEWGYDDEWNPIVLSEKKDSVVVGTVGASSDGNVFVSYYTDSFNDNSTNEGVSYVVDLKSTTGINTVADDKTFKFDAIVSGNNIIAGADVCKMEIFDLQGRKINSHDNQRSVSVSKGIYVVRTIGDNGKQYSRKIVIR